MGTARVTSKLDGSTKSDKTHLSGIWVECTKYTHSLEHFPLHLNPNLIAHQKLSKDAKQLRKLNEWVDHTPRMRTDLTKGAECRFFLLVRRLWVLQCVDKQWEDLADEGDEVLARYAPQQTNALNHMSGYDGLGIFGFGKEDVEEGVGVWFDQAVGGRKQGSEHLSGYDPSLSIVLLVFVPVRPKSDWDAHIRTILQLS